MCDGLVQADSLIEEKESEECDKAKGNVMLHVIT
jgi:hypothetical protein